MILLNTKKLFMFELPALTAELAPKKRVVTAPDITILKEKQAKVYARLTEAFSKDEGSANLIAANAGFGKLSWPIS